MTIIEKLSTIFERMLGYVTDDRDKREGSVIYDAVKPAAEEVSSMQVELDEVQAQSKALTATGDDLDDHVAMNGTTRLAATKGKVIIAAYSAYNGSGDSSNVTMELSSGVRFSTVDMDTTYTFAVGAKVTDATYTADYPECYLAECDTAGYIGDASLAGTQVQVSGSSSVSGLAYAEIIGVSDAGSDEEDDDALRERFIDSFSYEGFGGNRPQYLKLISENDSLKSMQVLQLYTGAGGRVVVSALDSGYGAFDSTALAGFMNVLDPQTYSGTGAGLVPMGHRVIVCSPDDFPLSVAVTDGELLTGWTQATAGAALLSDIETVISGLQTDWASADDHYQYPTVEIPLTTIYSKMLQYMKGDLTVNGQTVNGDSANLSVGTFTVPGTESDRRIENGAVVTAPVSASKFPRFSSDDLSVTWKAS
jgi:uncharacterized phage protein gp47/JayE